MSGGAEEWLVLGGGGDVVGCERGWGMAAGVGGRPNMGRAIIYFVLFGQTSSFVMV